MLKWTILCLDLSFIALQLEFFWDDYFSTSTHAISYFSKNNLVIVLRQSVTANICRNFVTFTKMTEIWNENNRKLSSEWTNCGDVSFNYIDISKCRKHQQPLMKKIWLLLRAGKASFRAINMVGLKNDPPIILSIHQVTYQYGSTDRLQPRTHGQVFLNKFLSSRKTCPCVPWRPSVVKENLPIKTLVKSHLLESWRASFSTSLTCGNLPVCTGP